MKKILLVILAVAFAMSFTSKNKADEKPRIAQKIEYKPVHAHRRW